MSGPTSPCLLSSFVMSRLHQKPPRLVITPARSFQKQSIWFLCLETSVRRRRSLNGLFFLVYFDTRWFWFRKKKQTTELSVLFPRCGVTGGIIVQKGCDQLGQPRRSSSANPIRARRSREVTGHACAYLSALSCRRFAAANTAAEFLPSIHSTLLPSARQYPPADSRSPRALWCNLHSLLPVLSFAA